MNIPNNHTPCAIGTHPAARYKTLEYKSRDEIEATQNQLFKDHVAYAVEHSPYYRSLFEHHKIDPADIEGIDDLARIPCTDKSTLENHNNDFLAVPREKIVDVCLTSATTRTVPTMLLQTSDDLARLSYNEYMAFRMVGITPADTMLICAALDRCYMAGLAYFLGGARLGTCMVRGGSGSAAFDWYLLNATNVTAIMGVPSTMMKIAEYAIENGDDPARSSVKYLIGIGEPTRNPGLELLPAAQRLEQLWDASIFGTYASTELATTFCECPKRKGGHLRPELVVLEILDDNGEPVEPGTPGEVVVTPLGVKGMPLIRFKTGDISFVITKPCDCRRNTPRLAPIIGRKNQMLKYKGTTIFPSTIMGVLDGLEYVHGGYLEAHRNPDGTDRVILYAAVKESEHSKPKLIEELKAHARVVPEIECITEEELNKKIYLPGKRKKITFYDKR